MERVTAVCDEQMNERVNIFDISLSSMTAFYILNVAMK